MKPLEPPDCHHLRAASGWLELNNPREAAAELQQLSAAARMHPDTLEVLWQLCAANQRWQEAVEFGRLLVRLQPSDPSGWLHRSYALHELRRTEEALTLLVPAAAQFPKESIIPYNLACYCCQLGKLDEARAWLANAARLRGRDEIRRLALADSDLQPLWSEIAEWSES
ncbi:MAG: tetratricopeptide repeat protein [Verrucomicrobia bacterium]|nr:tetratricopeptide repeat protein [Verrucomicrobiota bacterium]